MICLMLFSTTLVHAATISTFANGDSEVDVDLRDQGSWGDDLTAGISMPAGETVNAAANFAYNTRKSAAVLLSQKMIGAKQFKNG